MPNIIAPNCIWTGASSKAPILAWTSCRLTAPNSTLSNESGNSPADSASTTATLHSSIASSMPSKLNSPNGLNPTLPFEDYAQLLKTLCLTTSRDTQNLAGACGIAEAEIADV